MGLPVSSWLDPSTRGDFEDALRRAQVGLRLPRWIRQRPVLGLVTSSVLGSIRVTLKSTLLVPFAVVAAARRRRLQPLWTIPRALTSLLAGALLLGLGKLLAAVQTLAGLEPAGRGLTEGEQELLRRVFGGALDLEQLKVKTGWCGLASLTDRPFVHGEVLYLKTWPLEPALLVHEAVHWWQHQHGGSDYMLDSLWSQAFGRGYRWRSSVPQTPWRDLETEQQASMIEDAFRAGYFRTGRFEVDGRDLTAVVEVALGELRAGRGAP